MSSRHMCLLPRATLHSDSEHLPFFILYHIICPSFICLFFIFSMRVYNIFPYISYTCVTKNIDTRLKDFIYSYLSFYPQSLPHGPQYLPHGPNNLPQCPLYVFAPIFLLLAPRPQFFPHDPLYLLNVLNISPNTLKVCPTALSICTMALYICLKSSILCQPPIQYLPHGPQYLPHAHFIFAPQPSIFAPWPFYIWLQSSLQYLPLGPQYLPKVLNPNLGSWGHI